MPLRLTRTGPRQRLRSRGDFTLALGIGATTAVFSVVQGVVLAPLPYKEPDRLVLVLLYNQKLKSPTYLSYSDFRDWRRNSRSFARMAAFTPQDFDLTSGRTIWLLFIVAWLRVAAANEQTVIGLMIGVIGSLFLTRFLVAFLYGVRPTDPAMLAITSALIFLVALIAALIPAYRATKIDPMVALRYE